ncbi:hypothetical protein PAPHI01_0042 [Pancytospora philotis]|nr:hypothetical protein PAPHI01_0042 [Pancytospora philotis]
MATKRRNILSMLVALICWLFLRQPPTVEHERPATAPSPPGRVVLGPETVHRLSAGCWYVLIDGGAVDAAVEHILPPSAGLAILEVSGLETAKIACALGAQRAGEIIALENNTIYGSSERRSIQKDVSWFDAFDYYFYFRYNALKQSLSLADCFEDAALAAGHICTELVSSFGGFCS